MSKQISRCPHVRRIFVLALAALAHVQAAAQPAVCDVKLLSESQKLDLPYAVRANGYCDGTVALDNSAVLQIVSYTVGPVWFTPHQPRMKLQSAVPVGVVPLKAVGVDKRPGGSYRLDAIIPEGGLDFDLNPAIHPKGLNAEHLGIVAWHSRNGRAVYVPVVAGGAEASDATLLVMRAPTAIVRAAYEICVEDHPCGPQQVWAKDLEAGSRLELRLPIGPSVRQATVKIVVLGPGGRVVGDVLHLLIP